MMKGFLLLGSIAGSAMLMRARGKKKAGGISPLLGMQRESISPSAAAWNAGRHSPEELKNLRALLALPQREGDLSQEECEVVAHFQRLMGLTIDGKAGPSTMGVAAIAWEPTTTSKPFGLEEGRLCMDVVSGNEGEWNSINQDGEFRGLFGTEHAFYDSFHVGISWGRTQFAQSTGSLGKVLKRVYELDAPGFDAIFNGRALAVVEMTNRGGEPVINGRNPRVQKLDGADLWEEPWLSRFRALGDLPAARDAQVEISLESYTIPAAKEGIKRGGALQGLTEIAVISDMMTQFGRNGARKRLNSIGPSLTGSRSDVLRVISSLKGPSDERTRRLRRRRSEVIIEMGKAGAHHINISGVAI